MLDRYAVLAAKLGILAFLTAATPPLAGPGTGPACPLGWQQARAAAARRCATLREAEGRPFEPFNIGRAHVAVGEPDRAFAWLERSNLRWPHRAVRDDPALDPLRPDPRFARIDLRIERELGLRKQRMRR